jgi:uncharacterized protein with HEPN domain
MPAREWMFRIEGILEAIKDIEQRTKEMTYGTFCSDKKTVKTVPFLIPRVSYSARKNAL